MIPKRKLMQDQQNTLNCFVRDTFEISTNATDGVLSGKTFVIKDLFAISGHVSSFGHSRWRETHAKSTETAPVVNKLLEAGAVMVGITKMDQLAYSLVGNVGEDEAPVNPLYPDRYTGGSSSGSASAVAGNSADIGIGTDTGGSIRIPAASCGIYSIRPTHGRISLSGVIPLAPSFDTVGICARDPNALFDTFSVLSNCHKHATPIKKILILKDALTLVDPQIAELITKFANKLAFTLDVSTVDSQYTTLSHEHIGELFSRLQAREIWDRHGEWVKKNQEHLAPDVQTRLQRAEHLSGSPEHEIRDDRDKLKEYNDEFTRTIKPGEIAIVPIMQNLPPKLSATDEELWQFRKIAFRLSALASLSGTPEVVIPIHSKATDLTYGIGLLGARDEDETLLRAAINTGYTF